jgi:hypothetical protein
MNAQEGSKYSSLDESLDVVYEKEFCKNRAPRTGVLQVRTKEMRATPVERCAHLERCRSMIAPTPLCEGAWFI